MKKYLSTALIVIAAVAFSFGQTAREDKRVTRIMNDLQQACQLSADQATKVQPIVQTYVNTASDNKKKYGDDKASLKSANESNRKNFKANLATVLSADQIKQYDAYRKQEHQQKKNTRKGDTPNQQGSSGQNGN